MKKLISLCILFALKVSSNAITISTLDEQFSQNNQTVLRFKIENNSNDTLKEIELRYHVKQETARIAEPDLFYLPDGMANWSDWSKNDDLSQPTSNTFSIANNVEVLSNGKPLMLTAAKNAGCPVVQFVEVQKDSIALQILQKLDSDSSFITIKNKTGNFIQANLDDAKVDSLGQKIWHGNLETANTIIKQSSTIKVAGSIIEHSPHENSTKQAYDNFFENTFNWNLDFEINNTRVLNSGENLTSGLLSYNFRKVDFNFNSGSSLILNVPGEFYAGALKFQRDSKLIPQTNGSVIFYVGNDFQWNGTILVHQDTKVTWVPFLRETVNAVIAGVYN